MWDAIDPPLNTKKTKPTKPFFLRFRFWKWLFLVALILALLAAAAGYGGFLYLKKTYGPVAEALDLSKLQDMETASLVFDRNDQPIGKIYIQNRETIPFADIPPVMVSALVAAEDNRFWQHHGPDYIGIARAALKNWRSGRTRQGASTITQQLARNSYPDVMPSSDRSLRRKIVEIFVAWRIEDHFTKQQILESYLNRVYFGAGFYGIEAASRGYFGKPAKELKLSECATLAGLLRRPEGFSPWRNHRACIEARNFVLGRMLELGMITREQYESTRAEELKVKNRQAIHAESYAIEYVRQQVAGLLGNAENVYNDGFRIYTTLDSGLQKTAEDALQKQMEEVEHRKGFNHPTYAQYDARHRAWRKKPESEPPPPPGYLQGALYAIDNATGGVLALVGGRDFSHNQYNRALLANRPAGTAFTPLVYAAAFEKGIFPGSVWRDDAFDNRLVMIGGLTGILGEWGVERAENAYEGPLTAHDALVKSKNSATVRLGLATGLENVLSLAKAARIQSELRRFPATYLGSSEVTLEDLTLAFAMFATGGERPQKPFIIRRVERKEGGVAYEQSPGQSVRVIRPETAWEVHSALADSLEWGSAEKATTRYGLKKAPFGGKTGTAYNFTDVWFVGYSSGVTCGVWAGFDSPSPIYYGAFSNDIVLPVWVKVMNASLEHWPAREIARPATVSRHEICRITGQLISPQCVETHPAAGATGSANAKANPPSAVPDASGQLTGEPPAYSTSAFEWGTEEQAPRVVCELHTGAKRYTKDEEEPDESLLHAVAVSAVDVSAFQPVYVRTPTVSGSDPYQSVVYTLEAVPVSPADAPQNGAPSPAAPNNTAAPVAPVYVATPVDEPEPAPTPAAPVANPTASATPAAPPVFRAERAGVRDAREGAADTNIKLDAPEPIKFE